MYQIVDEPVERFLRLHGSWMVDRGWWIVQRCCLFLHRSINTDICHKKLRETFNFQRYQASQQFNLEHELSKFHCYPYAISGDVRCKCSWNQDRSWFSSHFTYRGQQSEMFSECSMRSQKIGRRLLPNKGWCHLGLLQGKLWEVQCQRGL